MITIREVDIKVSTTPRMLMVMFDEKMSFIELLKPVEDFTHYPFDLSQKENQLIIKDFVGRITEELMEAFTPLKFLNILSQEPKFDKDTQEAVIQTFYELNEELADVVHFYIEMMILIGLNDDDVIEFFKSREEETNIKSEFDIDLTNILYYARTKNILDGRYAGNKIMSSLRYRLVDKNNNCIIPFDTQGGMGITQSNYETSTMIAFDIIYNLNLLRAQLKKKQWRDNEDKVDLASIKSTTLLGFENLMFLFDMIGYNETSIYCCYLKKDIININRIEEKQNKTK